MPTAIAHLAWWPGALLLPLVLASAAVLFVDDWRLNVGLLFAHVSLAALVTQAERGRELATAGWLAGASVCAVLWSSRAAVGRTMAARRRPRRSRVEAAFQGFLVLGGALAALVLSQASPLPGLSRLASFLAFWAPIAGLVILVFSTDVLKIGVGLAFLSTLVNLLGLPEAGGNRILLLLALNAVWIAMALVVGFVLFWLARATGDTRVDSAWVVRPGRRR